MTVRGNGSIGLLEARFLNGTPYNTADFSPRELQANRSGSQVLVSLYLRMLRQELAF